MSAIVGICYLDNRLVDRRDLERMVEVLAHRGMDGVGVWNKGAVGLGNRLLWTTPESLQEKLPLVNETDGLILTADARIDNRNELLVTLGFFGQPSSEVTDSQLILAAYEKWGELCPEGLLGDFAFAIWDKRRQVLFCARDHFGVKPFYYYRSGRLFAFASEIKALLCIPEIPRRLNEVRVADYLVPMLEDKEITFYRDILRLPPAHSITVDRKRTQQRQYWSLDPSRKLKLGSDEEYAEAFRELFTEAVRCRLRSAFPIGSMLSGGLDSSSVTCMARKLLASGANDTLHTFSAIFDKVHECDERHFINAVLAQGGFEPHYVHGDRSQPLANLDRELWHQDEPFYAPNLFIARDLQCAAQQQGVRVLLDGWDGDTTVSHGMAYLVELVHTGRWISLATELRGVAKHFNRPFWRMLVTFLVSFGLLEVKPLRQAWRALRARGHPTWWKENPTISRHFAHRIALEERFQALRGSDTARLGKTEVEDHYKRLTWGLFPFTLEVIDRTAAAFSLDVRFPFFDKRLVEFCLALPPEQKIYHGWTRLVMRRAMTGILPVEVQWRGGKSDFTPNFTRALLAYEYERLNEVILGGQNGIEKYVDGQVLRETFYRYISQKRERDALTVWKALTLALWLRRMNLSSHNHTPKEGEKQKDSSKKTGRQAYWGRMK